MLRKFPRVIAQTYITRNMSINRRPVVVIIGATGTGKTKLAIELAQMFDGEVINADSMQLYRGLDIVTNKVSDSETCGIPHHLIGCVDPLEQYTVVDYQKEATSRIDKILAAGKLPIVAGGTCYYVESILWKDILVNETIGEKYNNISEQSETIAEKSDNVSPTCERVSEKWERIHGQSECLYQKSANNKSEHSSAKCESVSDKCVSISMRGEAGSSSAVEAGFPPYPVYDNRLTSSINTREDLGLYDLDSATLYSRLLAVDPASAARLHPNNKRKVIRALEVFHRHGRSIMDVYAAQHATLRYRSVCVLWIHCDNTVLYPRLDRRVDDMIHSGLIQELQEFHDRVNRQREEHDYTRTIFQCIGFKEFHEYLCANDEVRVELLERGIEAMKTRTRQYVGKQGKWIRQRFLKESRVEMPPVYKLDGNDASDVAWARDVVGVARDVVASRIEGRESGAARALPLAPRAKPSGETLHYCKVCRRHIGGDGQYEAHCHSRGHRYRARRQGRQSPLTQPPATHHSHIYGRASTDYSATSDIHTEATFQNKTIALAD